MLTVGVLQADDVLAQFQAEHGNYPDMFDRMFDRSGIDVTTRHYRVHKGAYPYRIDECDAYIITGSARSVYEDEPWIRELQSFVVKAHECRKPLVGICFGHQLVGQALGGCAELADAGWGVGVHTVRLCGKQDLVDEEVENFRLIVSHRDQVTRLPEGAKIVASSSFCPIAAMQIGDHILTFQGHPEFTVNYSANLINMRRQLLGEEVYAVGLASLDQSPDNNLVARWIVSFMQANADRRDSGCRDTHSSATSAPAPAIGA